MYWWVISKFTYNTHFSIAHLHAQKGKSLHRLPERGIVTNGNKNTNTYQNTKCQIKEFCTTQEQFSILCSEGKFTRLHQLFGEPVLFEIMRDAPREIRAKDSEMRTSCFLPQALRTEEIYFEDPAAPSPCSRVSGEAQGTCRCRLHGCPCAGHSAPCPGPEGLFLFIRSCNSHPGATVFIHSLEKFDPSPSPRRQAEDQPLLPGSQQCGEYSLEGS